MLKYDLIRKSLGSFWVQFVLLVIIHKKNPNVRTSCIRPSVQIFLKLGF